MDGPAFGPGPEVSPRERCVWLPDARTLVLADPHLGKGTASAVEAPLADGTDATARLEGLLSDLGPQELVIAGDLLHSFSHVPRGVTDDLRAIQALVADAGADLVVTPGNHDVLLEEVFDGRTPAEHCLADGETAVCHGHELPKADAERYVIGHDHPALSVDGRKRPCVLYGPGAYEGADVIVLPTFTRVARGTTVNARRTSDFQSPLIRDIDGFRPGVYDPETGETLWFPPLGECRDLL
ncbi:metallophosphoesterase [Halobacteria archaeon AArc-dxtr1]|nr:metallophosphoesterase [Halobacteria archaeon AArc-dxtr1]